MASKKKATGKSGTPSQIGNVCHWAERAKYDMPLALEKLGWPDTPEHRAALADAGAIVENLAAVLIALPELSDPRTAARIIRKQSTRWTRAKLEITGKSGTDRIIQLCVSAIESYSSLFGEYHHEDDRGGLAEQLLATLVDVDPCFKKLTANTLVTSLRGHVDRANPKRAEGVLVKLAAACGALDVPRAAANGGEPYKKAYRRITEALLRPKD